ncbi:fumarylacetoacetate hydrolase family protein [Roseateles oligotrophus]|uniref:Fumarylacetoacetate hydrolase family protein n=1 Tax=Roseateles oligotrophus TaxID=1769250 RepID=A0ABT2YDB1_9BURK|nr:fumarylacetoacetate hydrolase family protein [Roseateles oligotrophus]MCV2368045.1 fumarylacetoacetate hydrolase family protein [Roseateles oligotrophus]
MNSKAKQDLALALRQAWSQSLRISAADWPDCVPNGEAAYAIQQSVAQGLGWLEPGRPQYWKSGGASRQVSLTHAPLSPTGVRQSPADFSDLQLTSPGIEAEIALRIGSEVTPEQAAGLSIEGARDLVDAMTVSVELVSSRWQEAGAAPALLRQADFLSHGALALGDWQPFKPRDWWAQACELRVNDGPVLRGVGGHTLDDPAWGLSAWLRHVTREGRSLPAGSVVTTGAWLSQAGLQPGDRASVGFAGLGSVTVQL